MDVMLEREQVRTASVTREGAEYRRRQVGRAMVDMEGEVRRSGSEPVRFCSREGANEWCRGAQLQAPQHASLQVECGEKRRWADSTENGVSKEWPAQKAQVRWRSV